MFCPQFRYISCQISTSKKKLFFYQIILAWIKPASYASISMDRSSGKSQIPSCNSFYQGMYMAAGEKKSNLIWIFGPQIQLTSGPLRGHVPHWPLTSYAYASSPQYAIGRLFHLGEYLFDLTLFPGNLI